MVTIFPAFLTCPQRAEVFALTLSDWRKTDWGREVPDPMVVCDDGAIPEPKLSMTCNYLRLLQQALYRDWDYLAVFEDDVLFNAHVRHNLDAWEPLRTRTALAASIYNGDGMADMYWDQGHDYVRAGDDLAGSQAFVLHRRVMPYILSRWGMVKPPDLMQDLRVGQLLGRMGVSVWCHRPSLVQHRGVPSTADLGRHTAPDFDPDWRA